MGICRFCDTKAGFLRSVHKECGTAHRVGLAEMTGLARDAASAPDFDEAVLRSNLQAIADRSFAGEDGIKAAIAEGWKQAAEEALSDGILTQEDEARLRGFLKRLAIRNYDTEAVVARLDAAAFDRLVLAARHAALAVTDEEVRLHELARLLDEAEMEPWDERELLARGWEDAVNGALENGVLSSDEETALVSYLNHFNLSPDDVDANEGHTKMVKAAVIREAAEGLIPQRLNVEGRVPFNLMKSEQLVWVMEDVDYVEIVTRRQRRGSSHGVSVRVAKGLYYSPRTFSSQTHEWEETVHVDTGMLGVTTKHIYFHGARKRFLVRYDRIVSFEPYGDGLQIMRDAQSAKPQSFLTGDGWFIYNLVTNLAQRS